MLPFNDIVKLNYIGLNTGYTIPSGWAVMVCPPAVHLNPTKYEDPQAFNPWRWGVSCSTGLIFKQWKLSQKDKIK